MRFVGIHFDLDRNMGLACSMFGESIAVWSLSSTLSSQQPKLVYSGSFSSTQTKFTVRIRRRPFVFFLFFSNTSLPTPCRAAYMLMFIEEHRLVR